jgi:hypothetical protein
MIEAVGSFPTSAQFYQPTHNHTDLVPEPQTSHLLSKSPIICLLLLLLLLLFFGVCVSFSEIFKEYKVDTDFFLAETHAEIIYVIVIFKT